MSAWRQIADSIDRVGLDYRGILLRKLEAVRSILDVGCGTGAGLARVKMEGWVAGIDSFLPYLQQIGESRYKHILRGQALFLPFRRNAFDVVLAISILEHLTKNDGNRLLIELERVARQMVILLTPNGYIAQDAKDMNPAQVHLSGWRSSELRERGYKVYGVGGVRGIRGDGGYPRLNPHLLWNAVAKASQPLVQLAPVLAFELLCIKTVKQGADRSRVGTDRN